MIPIFNYLNTKTMLTEPICFNPFTDRWAFSYITCFPRLSLPSCPQMNILAAPPGKYGLMELKNINPHLYLAIKEKLSAGIKQMKTALGEKQRKRQGKRKWFKNFIGHQRPEGKKVVKKQKTWRSEDGVQRTLARSLNRTLVGDYAAHNLCRQPGLRTTEQWPCCWSRGKWSWRNWFN